MAMLNFEIRLLCLMGVLNMRPVIGLLSVSVAPANAYVLQGLSQLITCTVSGNSVATSISWRFTPSGSNQQQTLSLGNSAKYSGGSTQNPSLTVLNFQSSDGGSYVCSATNAVGTQSSTVSVLRYIQQLTISVSPSDGTAVYGTVSYTIQCFITGTPQATSWTWQRRPHAGGSITTLPSGNKYSIVNSATGPHLTINNIEESDKQDYFCGATNVAGSQTSSRARLSVTGDPLSILVTPADGTAIYGDALYTIQCTITGTTPTSWSWSRRPVAGGVVSPISTGGKYIIANSANAPHLTINNIVEDDEQDYFCQATNAAGTVTSSRARLIVNGEQLTISVTPSVGTAIYGDSSYTIQCSITGTTQATSWTWLKRPIYGGSLTTISAGSKYTIINSATSPHLTINNIVEDDEKDYYCQVTNSSGQQTSTRSRIIVNRDTKEENIIIYVVIGIIPVLLLCMLIIGILCYRKGYALGQDKKKEDESSNNVSQQTAISNHTDYLDPHFRDSARGYDELDPNRQEMRVNNTTQDNTDYHQYMTIPANNMYLDPISGNSLTSTT